MRRLRAQGWVFSAGGTRLEPIKLAYNTWSRRTVTGRDWPTVIARIYGDQPPDTPSPENPKGE